MNALTIPKKLAPSDKVAVISASWGGPGAFPYRYQIGKERLQTEFGLQVVEMPHALSSPDFIYQNPQARADDLMQAFLDPEIKGIFSNIGGEDAIRLLPYVDYEVISQNPKVVLGYSDTTVLHFMCLKAGLASFYGTSVMTGFAENVEMHAYTKQSIWQSLFSSEPIGCIPKALEGWTKEYLDWATPTNQLIKRAMHQPIDWSFIGAQSHAVQGRLIGGCVEVLQFINGTELWPSIDDWQGSILFLETSEEGMSSVHFKRFLRNLAAQDILSKINGILFSKPGGCLIQEDTFHHYDTAILSVFEEYQLPLIPMVTHMDFGHSDPMWVMPYGCKVEIDPKARTVFLLEGMVQ